MKLLLDTHVFLWWIADYPRLPSKINEIIRNVENKLFLSAASGWEIAIKDNLGRLQLPSELKDFIPEQLVINDIKSLPIQMKHALHVYTLPNYHRDPFDRLLVAQSQIENLPLITADAQIARYPVKIIWQ